MRVESRIGVLLFLTTAHRRGRDKTGNGETRRDKQPSGRLLSRWCCHGYRSGVRLLGEIGNSRVTQGTGINLDDSGSGEVVKSVESEVVWGWTAAILSRYTWRHRGNGASPSAT